MTVKRALNRCTPEKIRSACWLALALMLLLVSSFAESSWPDIGPVSDLAKDGGGEIRQALHIPNRPRGR